MTVPDSQDISNGQIPYTLFACIGTGFTGICLGATLRRWYGITSLALFTRDTELGGTWWQNRYPGAACDVPSALYSLSFAPNANWSRILPPADELCAYLKRVAEQYGLVEKTRFGTEVERAVWAEERARWKLTVREMKTGRRFEHECSVLISGAGQFGSPRELDIPGVKNFRGPVFHSARWRHDVSLEGKRVVVFGNGCTAAQIVPSIVGQVKHLTQIVRAKHWVYPPVDARIPEWGKAVLRTVPGLTRIMRTVVYYLAEEDWQGFANTKAGKKFREKKRKQVEKYMRETAPVKYHDLLIPDFEIGCKRRVFDSNYLASLHSENLTLTNEKPLEIVENGVKMESGKVIEADVIVLANGFNTNSALSDIEIVGRGGETLAQHWERFGGPEAYNCTSLSGFPNFFLILGPNTLTGHTSAVMAIENGINYALRVLKPVLEGHASIACVKHEAEEAYFQRIQAALKDMVWTGCNNWYSRGPGGKVFNGSTYPWSQAYYWYACLFPVWKDWEYSGTKHKSVIVKKPRTGLWVISLVTLVSGLLAWTKGHPTSRVASLLAARTAALPLLVAWAKGILRLA